MDNLEVWVLPDGLWKKGGCCREDKAPTRDQTLHPQVLHDVEKGGERRKEGRREKKLFTICSSQAPYWALRKTYKTLHRIRLVITATVTIVDINCLILIPP
jgi:hypothetical protein